MKLQAVRTYALSLAGTTEEPHHDMGSFRVKGRIFATVPADQEHLHVFVDETVRDAALAMDPAFLEPLRWGGKVVGLRIRLPAAAPAVVRSLVLKAYEARAGARSAAPAKKAAPAPAHRIFAMPFASVYPAYVNKAQRKGRTQEEVDRLIGWLTGYDQAGLQRQLTLESDFETFFAQAPALNPDRALIKGVVCGVRVEAVEDPLMQKVRQLDKLIDELAKGKALDKIIRR